jgi:hypothetical protein
MIENALIAVTFLLGLFVFAMVLAQAGVAWFALEVLRMCERYRFNVRRALAEGRRSLPAQQCPGERWTHIQQLSFYQRLIKSYRVVRSFGLSRVDALQCAWMASRRTR